MVLTAPRTLLLGRSPAVFMPASVAGLALWVHAGNSPQYQDSAATTPAVADTDPVGYVGDLSPNARHPKQATSGKRAAVTLVSTANGKRAIRFDGTASILKTASFTQAAPVTVYAVATLLASSATEERLADGAGLNQFTLGWAGTSPNKSIRTYSGGVVGNRPTTLAPPLGETTCVVATFNGASSTIQTTNGAVVTNNPGTNSLSTGLAIGGAGTELAGFFANMDLYEYLLYAGVHDAATQAQVLAYLRAWAMPQRRLICDGDSMTAGNGATAGLDYPAQLLALLGSGWVKLNAGVGGQTLSDMQGDAASTLDPYRAALRAGRPVLIAWGGTNDLFGGASAATTYSRLVTYCQARQAAGWRVVVLTILPRSNVGTPGTFEADRQTVNTNMRTNWPTFADALADVAADARLGDAGDETNATYYADLVHLTDAGYAIVAGLAQTAIQGMAA